MKRGLALDRKIILQEQVIAEKERLLAEKETFLQEIFASKGWRWLTFYRNLKLGMFAKPEPPVDPPVLTDEKTYHAAVHHPPHPNRPKVVHAIANFLTGGSSRLVVDLVEHLGHKYDQEVMSFCIPSPLAYAGVTLHDFSGNVAIEQIETFIREMNPHILHVHYWGEGDAPWYRKVFTAAESWPGILIENVNTPVVPYVCDRVNHYVYVSEYAKNFAVCEADKSTVIYPGSNLALFDRKDAPIPDNVIGMVYRLDSDKLREDAIRVFIQVVKKRPRTRVLIVGGGEFFDAYRRQVAEEGASANFEFTGYVPYDKLPEYYQQMSIFVAPVWKESFGQVSPFAMSMKIPVAGYRIGALPEILGNEELLGTNADDLSDIIVNLLEDRERRIEIGRFNHQRVHERFSVEAMVAAYDRIYDRLIQDSFR
jgi:glycosyltransferase involved in cell wall biosynthesis